MSSAESGSCGGDSAHGGGEWESDGRDVAEFGICWAMGTNEGAPCAGSRGVMGNEAEGFGRFVADGDEGVAGGCSEDKIRGDGGCWVQGGVVGYEGGEVWRGRRGGEVGGVEGAGCGLEGEDEGWCEVVGMGMFGEEWSWRWRLG